MQDIMPEENDDISVKTLKTDEGVSGRVHYPLDCATVTSHSI